MTRRCAATFVALLLLFVGCGSTSEPSSSCAGFRLEVLNGLSDAVHLTIGSDWMTVVEAGATETVTQFQTQPTAPPLPWLVEIYDATGRITLYRATMSGPADQRVTVSETGAVATPIDLPNEGC